MVDQHNEAHFGDGESIPLSPDQTTAKLDIKPSSVMMSPTGVYRRTFFNRTFSSIGKGSLRGSIFALCSGAIGSGVLSLPFVLKLNGWLLGLGFILLGATGACWSNRILARLACEHGCMNLSTLAKKAGGEALSKAMAYMVITYVLGGCISY